MYCHPSPNHLYREKQIIMNYCEKNTHWLHNLHYLSLRSSYHSNLRYSYFYLFCLFLHTPPLITINCTVYTLVFAFWFYVSCILSLYGAILVYHIIICTFPFLTIFFGWRTVLQWYSHYLYEGHSINNRLLMPTSIWT